MLGHVTLEIGTGHRVKVGVWNWCAFRWVDGVSAGGTEGRGPGLRLMSRGQGEDPASIRVPEKNSSSCGREPKESWADRVTCQMQGMPERTLAAGLGDMEWPVAGRRAGGAPIGARGDNGDGGPVSPQKGRRARDGGCPRSPPRWLASLLPTRAAGALLSSPAHTSGRGARRGSEGELSADEAVIR